MVCASGTEHSGHAQALRYSQPSGRVVVKEGLSGSGWLSKREESCCIIRLCPRPARHNRHCAQADLHIWAQPDHL
jgi:hypothetical protein